jgi:hypothetical protein
MRTAPARARPAPASRPPVEPRAASRQRTAAAPDDRDPLIGDIRLLGRILGEVIREQEGRDAYELVERVRQLSVAYRLKADKAAGAALGRLLKRLTVDQTVSVIRAFAYFSHLANIAEDRHNVRRRDEVARRGELPEGSLAATFERLAARDVRADEIARMLERAYVSPVLTAHPTEVQRKSLLDAERAVGRAGRAARRARLAARARAQRGVDPLAASRSCGRRGCCATRSSPSPTRSRTRCRTTAARSCRRSRGCTPTSRTRSPATRSRRSSGWATGSAATATATRT